MYDVRFESLSAPHGGCEAGAESNFEASRGFVREGVANVRCRMYDVGFGREAAVPAPDADTSEAEAILQMQNRWFTNTPLRG